MMMMMMITNLQAENKVLFLKKYIFLKIYTKEEYF